MAKVILDFPSDFDGEEYLLDANYNFYDLSTALPGNFVFVELYVAAKEAVKQLPRGTPSLNHTDALFFEARNYRNIGGGFVTFERHFVKPQILETTEFTTLRAFDIVDRLTGLQNSEARRQIISFLNFDELPLYARGINPGDVLSEGLFNKVSRIRANLPQITTNLFELDQIFQTRNFRTIATFSKPYTGSTAWTELTSAQKNESLAERFEQIQSESKNLIFADGFVLAEGRTQVSSPPIYQNSSTKLAPFKIDLETQAQTIEGQSYDLWNGKFTVEGI